MTTITYAAPSAEPGRSETTERRLLEMVANAPNGLLPIRRINQATVGAAGLLIPREDAVALEEFSLLTPPLVAIDTERFYGAMGAIQTARARLTPEGELRLKLLRGGRS